MFFKQNGGESGHNIDSFFRKSLYYNKLNHTRIKPGMTYVMFLKLIEYYREKLYFYQSVVHLMAKISFSLYIFQLPAARTHTVGDVAHSGHIHTAMIVLPNSIKVIQADKIFIRARHRFQTI